jgi:hypothetical protein
MTLGLALYGPCLGSFFLADDFLWLRPLSFREVLGFLFQSWGHGQAYRPVMRLDYFFDFALFGAEPLGWHIKNVVIHSLNALVLWHIVYTLSQSKRWSYAVLTLFAVSPLVHENVAWISGRTYLLGAFFMFLSLLLLIRSAQNKAVLKLDFIASCCFYTIGIVTYEAVVSLPFLAGLFAVRQYFISKPQNLKTSMRL